MLHDASLRDYNGHAPLEFEVLQTILTFHELAQPLFKFIIKLLLSILLEKEADQ